MIGAVTGVVIHPIVGEPVEAAGDAPGGRLVRKDRTSVACRGRFAADPLSAMEYMAWVLHYDMENQGGEQSADCRGQESNWVASRVG